MNILVDKLPESLEICGQNCPIRSDFRTWIKVSRIMLKGDGGLKEISEVLKLVFYDLPPKLEEAMKAIMWFYSPPKEKDGKKEPEGTKKPVYDFDYDAEIIYSAFFQQYRIDLNTADLHWWQFKALFDGLAEDTHFMKIVQFRSVNLSDVKDKEYKKYYRKMKNLCKLPDMRTSEQKEEDFNERIATLF